MTQAPEWRAPLAPLRVLVACGWLSDIDAGDARTCVETVSSSHVVFKVVAPDGRAAVVKQVPRAAAAAGRSLRQEMFVYRLARSVPAVAAALPAPIHIDETRQILVVTGVDGVHAFPDTGLRVPGCAERLATLMAGWHRATQDTGLWPSPALGILEMPDDVALASAGRAEATQRLMAEIVGDGELSGALRAARTSWLDTCLIHGDIRRENWIATMTHGVADVKVIDWELSGSGDPAWDVAGILTEICLETVREDRAPGSAWTPDQEAVVCEFVRAYAKAGGFVSLPSMHDAWDHVVLCAVGRLLHVACEWAETQGPGSIDPMPALVEEARGLLRRRGELVDALGRWSCA